LLLCDAEDRRQGVDAEVYAIVGMGNALIREIGYLDGDSSTDLRAAGRGATRQYEVAPHGSRYDVLVRNDRRDPALPIGGERDEEARAGSDGTVA